MTGMARPHVNNAKQKLLRRRVVVLDGKKIGLNKHYQEWGVPQSVHVPESVHPSTEGGNKNVPEKVRKSPSAGTHKRRETKDSLTREPTEGEKKFRNDLLVEMRIDDFKESIKQQWPIIRDFFSLIDENGQEKFDRKWRRVKRLDRFRDIRKLETLFSLYKSQPL